MEAWEATKNALEDVLEAVAGESILIVSGDEKMEVRKSFRRRVISAWRSQD